MSRDLPCEESAKLNRWMSGNGHLAGSQSVLTGGGGRFRVASSGFRVERDRGQPGTRNQEPGTTFPSERAAEHVERGLARERFECFAVGRVFVMLALGHAAL